MSQFEADPRSRSCQKELTPSHVNIHRPSLSIYLPSILHPLILLPYRVLLLRCNLTCLNSATYYQHIEPVTSVKTSQHGCPCVACFRNHQTFRASCQTDHFPVNP
eukprot:1050350-Prorocentrum_minimum.AAC.1